MTGCDSNTHPAAACVPPGVGGYVRGAYTGPRQVVRWDDQYRAAHELDDGFYTDVEAYLTAYVYPQHEYCSHFARSGNSPRGYAGPAGCRHVIFDVDRPGDLAAALTDTRNLTTCIRREFGPEVDDGIGVYFSGGKGFHATLDLPPAYMPAAGVPAACRRVAEIIAAKAGVRIDTAIYDYQRLVRLPNSRHPRTGFYKRFIGFKDLHGLGATAIQELSKHPAGHDVPACRGPVTKLADIWASAMVGAAAVAAAPPVKPHPVVPKFVRDFIGFGDVQDPGRAMTLFRCAASLTEAGTPQEVVFGLLTVAAEKSGLKKQEVTKQIWDGIREGRSSRGAP